MIFPPGGNNELAPMGTMHKILGGRVFGRGAIGMAAPGQEFSWGYQLTANGDVRFTTIFPSTTRRGRAYPLQGRLGGGRPLPGRSKRSRSGHDPKHRFHFESTPTTEWSCDDAVRERALRILMKMTLLQVACARTHTSDGKLQRPYGVFGLSFSCGLPLPPEWLPTCTAYSCVNRAP
jgi:hypothetical protein